jgi:NTP pyrophosphatase (non-canonical NTP hydrolase)|tara:strand:- start:599 stop:904 length:306 start_codon:yes stop_codon:yes gene_type:complete
MKFNEIRNWAKDKGILDKGDIKTQYIKLQEECGELAEAILKQDKLETIDAVGDIIVVLTSLSHLGGFKIETAIETAWLEIANRKGKIINNNFVKDIISGTE